MDNRHHRRRIGARGQGPAGQAGFSLVELIAVVVILGAVTASAVPRYIDVVEEAHRSEVAMIAGSFHSAVVLANAGCIVLDYAGRDNLGIFGAANLDFNANCFPSATGGSNNLNVNNGRCVQVWNGILQPAPTVSAPVNDDTDFRAQGSGTVCTYTYRDDDDTLRRFTYNAANGQVRVMSNP
jgi:prepilin-type N-terminal cleavage/methylation domain-containing protein